MKLTLKKEYIFLIIFVMIVVITGYVLIRFIVMRERASDTAPELLIKPAYLFQPIPKIDRLKTILDNPKFKEMLYIETFFEPITVEQKGRPNPFVPFLEKKE
ncbi:hypothetical protein MYX06_05000 [Patescibacteria group bacterium AH-259-L05]|nr:hypothetical protein [Patescibacteria group bacterium AH-259-L05]